MNIKTYWDDLILEYVAYDESTYDGAPDAGDLNTLGFGDSRNEAIAELKQKFYEQEKIDSV
jgi:hypothetical protein